MSSGLPWLLALMVDGASDQLYFFTIIADAIQIYFFKLRWVIKLSEYNLRGNIIKVDFKAQFICQNMYYCIFS